MTAATKLRPLPNIKTDETAVSGGIKNGRVVSVDTGGFRVDLKGNPMEAKKAFSCFADPLPGDRVICAPDESGRMYILGILEREVHPHVTISYPGDAQVVSKTGRLSLRSKTSLSLASPDISLFSQKTVHKSREAVIAFDETTATGRSFQASFKTVKLISRMMTAMAKQVIHQFQGYIRNTEGDDRIKAGQMTRQAEGMYAMDSKYTIMVSKKDTKIDGERIHMG